MQNAGVTPEELLRDFSSLVNAQTKSLRALAQASGVGIETIRGWKDLGRFPRSTDDFLKVVQTCTRFINPQAPHPPWRMADWQIRYQEAKRIWENQENDRQQPKTISGPVPAAFSHRAAPHPAVQVYGGDYVDGDKNSVHIGDVNHHYPDQQGR